MLDALGDETWIIGGVAFDVRVGVPGPASGVSTLTATLVTVDGVPMTRQQFMGLIGAGMQDPLPVEDRLVAATVGVITSAGVELSFNGTIRDAYRATASGFRHNGTSVARAWLRRTQQGRMFPFSRSLLLRDLRGAGTRPLPFRNELARAHRLCLGNPTKTRPGVDRLARKLRFAGRLMLLAGAVTAAIELAGSDNKGRTGASLFGAAAGGALGGWGAAALVSGLATGPVAPAVLGVATLLGLFGGGSLGAGGSEALYDSVFIRR